MLEYALKGNKKYWGWLLFLSLIIATGFYFYLRQLEYGLGTTGMSRNISWGLYIAQFTFIVGVAASAVMVVLPYYLHNYKAFGKITILGEFLAIASVIMCILFVFVDLGQPFRLANIFLYPTFHSLMFWDVIALSGYLILNVIITRVSLAAEYKSVAPPRWIRPIIILSIPWAVSIHTVTAFLLSGLAGRPFWLTAILAPRFLASAFSAGPALLLLFTFIIKKLTKFDPGDEAIKKLSLIITYAMCVNVFFILMEFFTTFYAAIPEHVMHLQYLYVGLDGKTRLVPWMWTSGILSVASLVFLIIPRLRRNYKVLTIACMMVFLSIWIDKGLGLIITGFIPTPFGKVVQYWPTVSEALISLAIWAVGIFLITIFYKVALSMRRVIET
jgi:molybdopterin-containing oxidoreductase family membrane subunit